jgi:hypothetical protein
VLSRYKDVFQDTLSEEDQMSCTEKSGLHDVRIINRINMTGEGAETRCTYIFIDAAPMHVPPFSNVHAVRVIAG